MDIQLQPFLPHGSVCPCMLQRAKPCSILFGYSKSRVSLIYFLTRTDFINKRVYPKEGTRVRIPGTDCIRTQFSACIRLWVRAQGRGDGS